jgi:DNA-3-methyladenine glycosylase I
VTDAPHRCSWANPNEPLYLAYHDEEWGVPLRDERALYELLTLEGFQAGLAWITVLKKREAFRRAFEGFRPETVARYGEADVVRILADPGVIRARAKIEAAIGGARAVLKLREQGQDLSAFLWSFTGGKPIQNRFESMADVPAQTPLSAEISKALKAKGFNFVGPVIVYAFMQACGMVNDHVVGCFRHDPIRRMGE